jgi:hypothetical protein
MTLWIISQLPRADIVNGCGKRTDSLLIGRIRLDGFALNAVFLSSVSLTVSPGRRFLSVTFSIICKLQGI